MIDDAKIRLDLLRRFPALSPTLLEMEEFDFGDEVGVFYRHMTSEGGQTLRARARAVGKSEAEVADALAEQVATWFDDASGVKRGPGRPRKAA